MPFIVDAPSSIGTPIDWRPQGRLQVHADQASEAAERTRSAHAHHDLVLQERRTNVEFAIRESEAERARRILDIDQAQQAQEELRARVRSQVAIVAERARLCLMIEFEHRVKLLEQERETQRHAFYVVSRALCESERSRRMEEHQAVHVRELAEYAQACGPLRREHAVRVFPFFEQAGLKMLINISIYHLFLSASVLLSASFFSLLRLPRASFSPNRSVVLYTVRVRHTTRPHTPAGPL
jgi:hypothetical protein